MFLSWSNLVVFTIPTILKMTKRTCAPFPVSIKSRHSIMHLKSESSKLQQNWNTVSHISKWTRKLGTRATHGALKSGDVTLKQFISPKVPVIITPVQLYVPLIFYNTPGIAHKSSLEVRSIDEVSFSIEFDKFLINNLSVMTLS